MGGGLRPPPMVIMVLGKFLWKVFRQNFMVVLRFVGGDLRGLLGKCVGKLGGKALEDAI